MEKGLLRRRTEGGPSVGRRVALKNVTFVVNCHFQTKCKWPQSLEGIGHADKRGQPRSQAALIQLHEKVSRHKQFAERFEFDADRAVRAIVRPARGYRCLRNRKARI